MGRSSTQPRGEREEAPISSSVRGGRREMEGNKIVVMVVYGGIFVKMDDGLWEYKNGKNNVLCVDKTCTKAELEDKIFKLIKVDQNEYLLKLKFIYGECAWMSDPIEIYDDDGVDCFIREVMNGGIMIKRPPLYVEAIAKVPQFSKNAHPSDSGSNQIDVAALQNDVLPSQTVELEPVQDAFEDSIIPVPQPRDQVDIRRPWSSLNIHEGVDVGGDASERFPNQEEYDQLYNIGDFGNYNVEMDDIGNQLDDVGHNEVEFDGDIANDNNNVHNEEVNDVSTHLSSSRPSSLSYVKHSTNLVLSKFTGRDSIMVGQIFSNKKELKNKLSMHCIHANKEYKVTRSTKQRFEVVCLEKSCKWRLRATSSKNGEIFVVRTFDNIHSCSFDVVHPEHRQASGQVIGQCIKSKYEGIARVYKPKEIQHDFMQQYGVKIGYHKAWRGREHALNSVRGSPEESFSKLPAYCYELESKNLGTLTRIKTDDENCFEYFFIAIGACIKGFMSHMRPVLAVDASTLKGKYKGYMYLAAAMDGNGQIYPLAFGIGDGENERAWSWFFQNIRDAIGDFPELVFVSDRHPAIEKAIRTIFPNAHHGLCMYHISRNIKSNGYAKKDDDMILPIFYQAAKAYLVEDFDFYMRQIEEKDLRAAEYIRSCDPSRWARSHFPSRRYSILTTNIAECMNAILLDAREMPIVPFVEHVRDFLQRWFFERRTAAANLTKPVTNWMETELACRSLESRSLRVKPINNYEFLVEGGQLNGIVNLQSKTCSCKIFDLDQYPCDHCMAACKECRVTPYCMCSRYYTAETLRAAYAESIYPLLDEKQWHAPNEVASRIVNPPRWTRRRAGRPKTQRIPSQGEDIIGRKCSRCGDVGHNRRRCTNPLSSDAGESSRPSGATSCA